jgi:hypothetical protein
MWMWMCQFDVLYTQLIVIMACSIVFCVGLFSLTTAETECAGSTQCATVCWENVPGIGDEGVVAAISGAIV